MGMRGNGWGLAWLGAFVAWTSVQPIIISLFDGLLGFIVSEALATGCGSDAVAAGRPAAGVDGGCSRRRCSRRPGCSA